MKTKFILHGGYAGRRNAENDGFFKEIVRDTSEKVSVLLVYFAKDKEEYERMSSEDTLQFKRNGKGKDFTFDIASANDFINQIKRADIIYLHGGKTLTLLETLKQYPNLVESLKGKIIAGESAGAYVLSSCFYSKTEGEVFNGLGFVPAKTICHYSGENEDKLEGCPKELEALLLKDYLFKVFEKII